MITSMRYGISAAALMIGLASRVGAEEPTPWFGRWAARCFDCGRRTVVHDARATAQWTKRFAILANSKSREFYLTCLNFVEIETAKPSAADVAMSQAKPQRYLGRAIERARAGQLDAAIEDVNVCLKLDRNYPGAWLTRSIIWTGKKKFDRAAHDLCVANEPDPNAGNLERARRRVAIGDSRETAEDAGATTARDPRAYSFSFRASIRSHSRDYAGALVEMNKAIELDPNNALYYERRGTVYQRLGDFDAAIADCSRAIALDPNRAGAYSWRALAWLSKQDFAKADADFKEACRLHPETLPPEQSLLERFSLEEAAPNSATQAKPKTDAADRSRADDFSKVWSKRLAYGRFADDSETPDEQPTPIDPDLDRRNRISYLSKLAWRAATSPDERYRDGARAVEAALEACQLADWKELWPLEALAAAYAECGDFAAAVRYQKLAIQLWDEQQRSPFRQRPDKSDSPELDLLDQERQQREDRLDLYRNHKTYRGER